eukprot:CAMPEP_0170185538 /NCGR_PEP_ID=MMETSP0040_2-20121228/36803_1 /TAXON_ID=641309 /ORGANISM="Lotharella oceanica, Strain CCMP622" /LENGTH=326 /DNA_ID=CAMNT_0010431973 /DNA_START=31 /DNA_END=1011 /DNA_ORIENTATION=+
MRRRRQPNLAKITVSAGFAALAVVVLAKCCYDRVAAPAAGNTKSSLGGVPSLAKGYCGATTQRHILGRTSIRPSYVKDYHRSNPIRSAGIPVFAGGAFASPPTLKYFDARGAAEVIRYLFAASGTKYEDYRYPFKMEGTFGQPGFKVTKEEFDADKASFKLPFQKVPVIEVEGHIYAQSKAIERYVAKQVGLFGKNDMEGLKIDMVCEQIRDIRDAWTKAKGYKMQPDMTDESVASTVNTFFDTDLPNHMDMLQRLVSDEGYFVGGSLSLADIQFYNFLNSGFGPAFAEKVTPLLEKYPKLAAIKTKVASEPGIKEWEANRPQTAF